MDYVSIYFGDEVPVFGCGYHSVLVMGEEGSKQVRLLKTTTCDDAVIPRDLYVAMVHSPNSRTLDLDADAMAVRLAKNAVMYEHCTSVVRDALLALGVPSEGLPPELRQAVRTSAVIAVSGDAGPLSDAEVPLSGEGSGKFVQRLWMTGKYEPDDLVRLVLSNWPGRKTKKSDIFYNVNLLVKAGVENVPPWPKKGQV